MMEKSMYDLCKTWSENRKNGSKKIQINIGTKPTRSEKLETKSEVLKEVFVDISNSMKEMFYEHEQMLLEMLKEKDKKG